MKLTTLWVKNQTIDRNIEKQMSGAAKFWRDVLTRIIKIIIFPTAENGALREYQDRGNKKACIGNFLRTVKLPAELNPILNKLLSSEETLIKYLSWRIQN